MSHLIDDRIDGNNPAFIHLNLQPDEEIKYTVRHHWAGFLPTLLIVAAMSVFPIIPLILGNIELTFGVAKVLSTIVLILSCYYIFLLTFLFGAWTNFYYDIIFITNRRLINVAQEGLLSRKISALSLRQIQNVSAEVSGFLQYSFNFGLLVVETAGGGTTDDPHKHGAQGYFTITDMPDPNRLARVILEMHRELREKEKEKE